MSAARLLVALLASAAAGCTPPAWDAARLVERHPALRAAGAARLGDAQPYLLPADGVLTAFLCRWPDGAPIPVSLPPEATPDERRTIEAVLRAWERAGPDVRFERGAPEGEGIELRFADADPDAIPGTANTISDCLVAPEGLAPPARAVLPARLVFASVHLYRHNRDLIDRPVSLAPEQLAGSVLHELGHALGFQGHAMRGDTVMVRAVHDVRLAGQRVLDGRRFRDDTLRALYALPSGVVVRRRAVAAEQTRPVDRLLRIAQERGFSGPFVRVGDELARIGWRDREGRPVALLIPAPSRVLRGAAPLEIRPYGAAAALLGRRVN